MDGFASQVEISVHLWISHFFPNLRTDDIDLLLRVAQNAREEGVSESFETFHDLEVIPGADSFCEMAGSVNCASKHQDPFEFVLPDA